MCKYKWIVAFHGERIKVDASDYFYLSQFRWHLDDYGYARRSRWQNNTTTKMPMHREILGLPAGKCVDHIDRDTLNNSRDNLRLATKSDNGRNRGKPSNNTSGFKGVSWCRRDKKWKANIRVSPKGPYNFLGRFENKEDAAKEYDRAALKYHGVFAYNNLQAA